MAKTTASRKAKGRRLQTLIAERIRQMFGWLSESDVRSTPMGCTGEDIWLSEAAKKAFPYSVEAKNTEKLNIWAALKQAEAEARSNTPLVVFKKNRSEIYCALKFDDFMNLAKIAQQYEEEQAMEEINAES